ncbi:MAG: hypothetical protein A2Y98_03215 [Candidatus Portnoybacteria bacterium RBG_19FT_COMBO_36_7]|uniref:General secretion pathway GspH domain-containing protein n=1 Tax=Candidatus Portnoybacteria bacterium RBG_19FT_COMBO_36_7 TaxID=1801992 RepID=A0A1G2F7K3_9BACT|nr:MAG: hypothetical protein A2Y98_03215 [Candidatus Portnoybacteria bacterium RBG_19FT_COMBO_36_7]
MILKPRQGFTLLEMLIVLAIISIMATLILVRYREGQKTYVLSQAAQTLVGNIREAQNLAITGAEVKKPDGNDYPRIGGYGIYIKDETHYVLFMNEESDPSACPIGLVPQHEIKTAVKLPDGTTIDQLGKYIFYTPPNAHTCIEGDDEPIIFTIRQNSSGRKIEIYVNAAGRIEVQ